MTYAFLFISYSPLHMNHATTLWISDFLLSSFWSIKKVDTGIKEKWDKQTRVGGFEETKKGKRLYRQTLAAFLLWTSRVHQLTK